VGGKTDGASGAATRNRLAVIGFPHQTGKPRETRRDSPERERSGAEAKPREDAMPKVSMTVNGRAVAGEVEGRTLLVDFLRDGLRLTGTHVGCDTGQCGACVVHVDGVSVKSCNVFALDLEGAEVTTIEGMANPDGSLGVIQAAFQTHHGLQCGFCTPGMVMTAAALLKENASPSEAEIREYLDGNICRCTGYHNIVKAIAAAADELKGTRVAAE
jgi:aerobic carbon-monoxide dehydrogenase small subunit